MKNGGFLRFLEIGHFGAIEANRLGMKSGPIEPFIVREPVLTIVITQRLGGFQEERMFHWVRLSTLAFWHSSSAFG